MERLKRAAAIHDISGFGKCSLTVALPIISAMGIEVSVIPTAVLSTHTGGFTGFTYRDLTGDMRPIAEHWKSLGIKFDAIYSGFLGSVEQIDIVTDFIDDFKEKNTVVLVDPAMADGGKMYTVFDMGLRKANDAPLRQGRHNRSELHGGGVHARRGIPPCPLLERIC